MSRLPVYDGCDGEEKCGRLLQSYADGSGDLARLSLAPSLRKDAALPIAFAGIPGLYKPAPGSGPARGLAVLLISPWGIEEMCTRRFYRIMAESLAEAGIASLRFDFPGTANALDSSDSHIDLDSWIQAASAAASELTARSGARQVVLLGQGLGATIALKTAGRIANLAAVALLAPVLKGRNYLRELSVWSKVVDEGVGVQERWRDLAPGTIAGLAMPEGIVAGLPKLDLTSLSDAPLSDVFLAARPQSASDNDLRARLAEREVNVRDFRFDGYDKLVSNPLGQEIPLDLVAELSHWLRSLPAYSRIQATSAPASPNVAATLTSGPVRETAVRFGAGGRLLGTLCEPVGTGSDVTVTLLTTGYDHQAGWARSAVDLARRLALAGITTLRFDSAGVGDSPPVAGRKEQVLYDDTQIADVAEARRFLDEIGRDGPALLYGRCSGAYVAFRSAAEDSRWAGCIAVNPYIFRWLTPPTDDMVASVPRPLGEYTQKALRLDTVRRLFSGDIDTLAAIRNIGARLAQRASNRLAPLLGPLLPVERWNRAVHSDFLALSKRTGKVCLVYSSGDQGLDNFHVHFGSSASHLVAYPNAELHILSEADHNVTAKAHRQQLFDIVERAAIALASKTETAPGRAQSRSKEDGGKPAILSTI